MIARDRGRQVLVCAPNWRQFGHLALEVLQAYADARETGLPVYIVRRREAVNVALFEIEPTAGVIVLRPGFIGRARLHLALRCADFTTEFQMRRHRFAEQFRTELRTELEEWRDTPGLSRPVVDRVKDVRDSLKTPFSFELPRQRANERPHYYRRRLLRQPVPVRLSARAHEEAVRQAESIGLGEEMRIVSVHAREPGYKFGRETHDAKPDHARDDSTRNVRIESYFAAIDDLVDRGFTVVRIGDSTMTPVKRRGVIDLATMPERTPLLEIYCLMRSHLLVGSDSGPSAVAYLTNTPLVSLNCTDPIAAYPIRANALYTLKRVTDRHTGRALTLGEMLQFEYATNNRDPRRYRYYDNTPEEVVAAVREMLEMLDGRAELSGAQRDYHQRALAAATELRPLSNYIAKWGADDGFLGDGRISRDFVQRYL